MINDDGSCLPIIDEVDPTLKCPTCGYNIEIEDCRHEPNRIADFIWRCTSCSGFGWVIK